jgi:hypothetical protein
VIPEVAPQPGSASRAEEGSTVEVPPDTQSSTTQQHSVSTTSTPNPQPTSSKPIPDVVLFKGSGHGKRMKTQVYRIRKRNEGRSLASKVNSKGSIADTLQLLKRVE